MRTQGVILSSVLVLLLSFVSCNSKESTGVLHVDIRSAIDAKPENIGLSAIADKIQYIPLETNKACFLTGITKISSYKDYYFITDYKRLYQFNKNGRFIRTIGVRGKGPGEIGNNIRFAIDKENKEIYVLTYKTLMNVYDLDSGNYKRSFRINRDFTRFDVFKPGQIVIYTINSPEIFLHYTVYECFLYDSKGNCLDSIAEFSRRMNKNINFISYTNSYFNDMGIFYKDLLSDTLYHMSKEFKKEPYIIYETDNDIPYGSLFMPPEKAGNQFRDNIMIHYTVEYNNYLFVTTERGVGKGPDRQFFQMLYDKQSGKLTNVSELSDDIEGGPGLWPKFVVDGYLMASKEAYEIIDYYNNSKNKDDFSPDFQNLAKKLSANDNPVLMILSDK
ncbi:6-bladed beta-propeller [Saccharicrinis sp. FJH2]|uniref:6-bladed beta-propeller n=1 Tax=Saccharicrinis sp. FJH65 TaxID=3344659 RepID=UPI0035F4CEB3